MIYWDGNFLCDRGFFINLKRRTDRFESCKKELEKAKITGVEKFEAVELPKGPFWDFGCTQSHINIAKLQIENNWPYVLYLEDDIVLDVIYNLDIRNSGKQIDYSKAVKTLISDMNEYKPDVLWLGTRLEAPVKSKISNTLVIPGRTLMSHAYIGSLKYANFLVENLNYEDGKYFSCRYAIDWFITQINEKNCGNIINGADFFKGIDNIKNNDLKIMVSVPQFFVQGAGLSDISGNDVDYRKWCWDAYSAYIRIEELGIIPALLPEQ